jgi:hypothetical protein
MLPTGSNFGRKRHKSSRISILAYGRACDHFETKKVRKVAEKN